MQRQTPNTTTIPQQSRLAISIYVGKRNEGSTMKFCDDLRSRLVVMPTIISDGWSPYIAAIAESFGKGIDYAQMQKHYAGHSRRDDHRYEPPREPFITKRVIFGAPDLEKNCSTAYVERNNGTMRHRIGRIRRLSYAFSKDIEHHKASVALNYVHYNFCEIIRTLRVTPAMQVGITNHVWDIEEFYAALMSAVPCASPTPKPLVHTKPEGVTARELPGGRGFLRVVRDTGSGVSSSTTAPNANVGHEEEPPKPTS